MVGQQTFLLFVTLLLGFAVQAAPLPPCSANVPHISYQVVSSAKHNPTYFTQGLIWDDGEFVESTGQFGQSALIRWSPGRGLIARRSLDPEVFGEGLATLAGELWQLSWKSGMAYVYGREDLRLRRTLHYSGDGWGLTSDGEILIMSDGSDRLFERDAAVFGVTKITRVRAGSRPVSRLNELEYDAGAIWANVWQSDRIARIDYASGCVTGWLDLSGLWPKALRPRGADVLNGIALHPSTRHLFVTGKYWPRVYEIAVDVPDSL